AREIVVDRLRQPDHVHATSGEDARHRLCAVAADQHEPVETVPRHARSKLAQIELFTALAFERWHPTGAEKDAAERRDALHRWAIQRNEIAVVKPPPAIDEADHLEAVHVDSAEHGAADRGVHSRTIPT